MNIDQEFYAVLRQAGCSGEAPEGFEGIGYLVTVLVEGAVEEDWVVESYHQATAQASALREWVGDDAAEWEFVVSEVYVGPDVVEGTGYMADEHF